MTSEPVLYALDGKVATITLNRPEVLNAMSRILKKCLLEAVQRASADTTARVVVLRGAGTSFSAGIDLKEGAATPFPHTAAAWRKHLESSLAICWAVWSCPKPVIAVVNGYALGAGCDLALSADIAVATPDAIFGEPEIADSSGPPSLMMPWVVGLRKSKELLLLGENIGADEALRIGMINRIYSPERLEEGVAALARRVSSMPEVAVELNKRTINKTFEIMGLRSALELNQEYMISIALARSTEERDARLAQINAKGLRAVLRTNSGGSAS